MSLHDFSNLAVQDISDEVAATQSGGVDFFGYNKFTGIGKTESFINPQVGQLGFFDFVGNKAAANDQLTSVKVTGYPPGQNFRFDYYRGTNFSGGSQSLSFTASAIKDINSANFPSAGASQATSAVKIFRV